MKKVLIQVVSYVKVDVSGVSDSLSIIEQQKLAREVALDEVHISSESPHVEVLEDATQILTPLDLMKAHAFVDMLSKK